MPLMTRAVSVEQRLDKFRLQIPTYVKYDFFFKPKNRLYLYFRGVNRKALYFIVFFGFIQFVSFFFFFSFFFFSPIFQT